MTSKAIPKELQDAWKKKEIIPILEDLPDDIETDTEKAIVHIRKMVPMSSANVKITGLVPKGSYGISKRNINEYGKKNAE